MSLHDMASARIDDILHEVRAGLIPSSSVSGSYRSPSAHCDNEAPTVNEEQERATNSDSSQDRSEVTEDVVNEEVEERKKRNREPSSDDEESDPASSSSRYSPLARPTEYLRTRCPLCFGGSW